MDAVARTLEDLYRRPRHFYVQPYQRTYRWTAANQEVLWNDLLNLYRRRRKRHFLGVFVTKLVPGGLTTDPQRVELVDGQQRLATVFLILCALRDLCLTGARRKQFTDSFLMNRPAKGNLRHRLLLQEEDRLSLEAIMDGLEIRSRGPIPQGYQYIRRLVRKELRRTDINPETFADAIFAKVEIADVTLDRLDSANQVFHALNATGLALSEVEKVKNYVFMSMPSRAESAYATWKLIERRLPGQVETFLLTDLIARRKPVTRREIFEGYRVALMAKEGSEKAFQKELARLERVSTIYERIIEQPKAAGRKLPHKFEDRLRFLNQWGAVPAHPLILRLVQHVAGRMTANELERALAVVEGFLVRRFLAGVPTNDLRSFFTVMMKDFEVGANPARSVREAITQRERHRWPTDSELRAEIDTNAAYDPRRAKYILLIFRRVAQRLQGKDIPEMSGWQIDHLLPQNPKAPGWNRDLRRWERHKDPARTREEKLNVIGNLTATPNNPNMQDAQWMRKRAFLKDSSFALNRKLARNDRWASAQIDRNGHRFWILARQIWPGPA